MDRCDRAKSGALQRRIPAGISGTALAMIRAIDLDHETLRGTARQRSSLVVASWQSIRNAIGLVRGETADAVADTAELYDG